MKVRKLLDRDIRMFSSGEITTYETISRKECIRSKGGIYDLSIFGTVDFCHCGLPAFPGWVCDKCNVRGIEVEQLINSGAFFTMPAPFITELSLRDLSIILQDEYDIKIPRNIKSLWNYRYNNLVGTFALESLSKVQGLEFVSDYFNRLFYVVHPYFRPISILPGNKYVPDDYSMGISLFIQSCILSEKTIENFLDMNLLYNEILKSSDGFKSGKDNGMRYFLRHNFVSDCMSGVIIPDPNVDVTSVGVPINILKNIPDNKRDWAFIIRYPVLHSYNLMAFRIVPIFTDDNCIHLHPLAVQPFGGDFDGDTMQVIFIEDKDSDFHIPEYSVKFKDQSRLYSFKAEYENYDYKGTDLNEAFINTSKDLTLNGLPPFSFNGDNKELERMVPKVKGKVMDSLFTPMYNLDTSLLNGLSYQDFVSLSKINREILAVKQDLVAISGYNTRQLVLSMWNENPVYATSFTEGMTQKALSLKHGGDNTVNFSLNKEKIVRICGRVAESPSEYFFVSDKYIIKDGWITKEIPVFARIFPVMRMLGFKLGSRNYEYIRYFKSISLSKNYSPESGIFKIGRDNKFYIGDKEFINEDNECYIVRDGEMVDFGQRITTGIPDISYYCDIFPIDLMKKIFIEEVTYHSGINFSTVLLEKIFDVLYNFKLDVSNAVEKNEDFLFNWYARSLGQALRFKENLNDPILKNLFGL